jgi:very-short-patch-repair endonuclease
MDLDAVARTAARHGGALTWGHLVERHPDHVVRKAVECGVLLRAARGRYVLPDCPDAIRQALVQRGVVSHGSAARLWFLETLHEATTTHVTVPAGGRGRAAPRNLRLHWRDLGAQDVRGHVTAPVRTVLDCARTMPFAEALAVADSALRRRLVERDELEHALRQERGRGTVPARRVVAAADARAANPFESGLRAIVLDRGVPGFTPQLPFRTPRLRGFVDLGDPDRRIALEADSFEFHGSRQAMDRDCRRYDELVRTGWLVLRFSWEQVMSDREWVADTVEETVAQRRPTRTRRSRSRTRRR